MTLPQAELIDPAVNGTLNVLRSCAKSPSVKRVVLTSSIAAVAFNGKPRTADTVVDESWWSLPDLCRQNRVSVFCFLFMRGFYELRCGPLEIFILHSHI